MFTPEAQKLEINSCDKHKIKTPRSSGGINKNLLTPCRRVGLSRKLKTSNSFVKKISEEIQSNSTVNVNTTHNETTPLTRNKSSDRKRLSDDTFQRKLKVSDEIDNNYDGGSSKLLFQSFISEDLFDNNENSPSAQNEIKVYKANETPLIKKLTSSEVTNNGNINNYLKDDHLNKGTVYDSDDDFVISKNRKRQRSVEKIYQVDTFRDASLKESNCIKKCHIKLKKLSADEVYCVSNNEDTEIKTYETNFTDDSHFFTSTPEEEETKKRDLEKKMRLLEYQIKQKRLKLDNLQRASIYKSKHNIQDLNHVTKVWLDGCVQALQDLVAQLQSHGPIDLPTLLSNMRIPKEVISKLPLEVK